MLVFSQAIVVDIGSRMTGQLLVGRAVVILQRHGGRGRWGEGVGGGGREGVGEGGCGVGEGVEEGGRGEMRER